ncbi:hypothetical protein ACP70R_031979 [Stipagrostis hirtigluma subsp. patula]
MGGPDRAPLKSGRRGAHSSAPPLSAPMEAARAPQPPAAAAVAVAGDAKRARKRSRYLSPPYTHTDAAAAVLALEDASADNEEAVGEDVSAADALSALHAAALLLEGQPAAPPLRFLALYRRSRIASFANGGDHPSLPPEGDRHSDSDAAAGNRSSKKLLSLNAASAMPMANGHGSPSPAPAPGSGTKKKKRLQPASAATQKQQDTAAMEMASQSANGRNAATDFTIKAANGVPNSANPKKKRNKKMKRNSGQAAQQFSNPVALVLDFAEGAPLPSRDELLSTFRKFGAVIDSEAGVDEEKRNARVVFAARAEAEAAYSCAETLGALGPPFATPRLQDLPPITVNAPPPQRPVPKLPLTDIRKNLERMICALTSRSPSADAAAVNSPEQAKPAMGNLVAEMQVLLAKVDKMLQVQGASSNVHHH